VSHASRPGKGTGAAATRSAAGGERPVRGCAGSSRTLAPAPLGTVVVVRRTSGVCRTLKWVTQRRRSDKTGATCAARILAGTRHTTNEGQRVLPFTMWIRRRRAEHSRRLQDARNRLLEYGVPPDHVDFLARHCAGTSPHVDFQVRLLLDFPKQYRSSVMTFIVAAPILASIVVWIYEGNPQVAMIYTIGFVLLLVRASLDDSRQPRSALIRMLLTVCEIESLLAFLREDNPLNRHKPKKISRGVSIHLKIDTIDEHRLFRELLIKHSRRLALDTHVVAGYASKYDDERWSRSAQVFLWVSEDLFSEIRARIGQEHCGVLLTHITHNRFLEPVSVDPKHKPINDLLATPRAKIARFVNFPLVVTLAGALVVSGASVVVALLRT